MYILSTNKQGIRHIVDEYFTDYSDFDSFEYNFTSNTLTIKALKAVETANHKNQCKLKGFEDNNLIIFDDI